MTNSIERKYKDNFTAIEQIVGEAVEALQERLEVDETRALELVYKYCDEAL